MSDYFCFAHWHFFEHLSAEIGSEIGQQALPRKV
jgi:hypothetical protein